MDFPIRQMLSWKAGTLGPTAIGISYIILPFLISNYTLNIGLVLFGFTFLAIGLIRARPRPAVLSCIFAMLIGLCFFFGTSNIISTTSLWLFSILLFLGVLVFELQLFKLGPANAKAKVLLLVPLAVIGFSYILAFAAPYMGLNTPIHIDWSNWMIGLNYLAVMLFCWISIFDQAGWRPLKAGTNKWLNALALVSVALLLFSVLQGRVLPV